jgi:hypothetical protein
MEYARLVADGTRSDPRLFFFHRQASDTHDLTTDAGVRAAVLEASGPVTAWSDIEAIVAQFNDPTADRAYLERVWLNRLVKGSQKAFDPVRWDELEHERVVPRRAVIVLGFDGARYFDSTALVATEVTTGFQFVLGLWERPQTAKTWEVPRADVDAAVEAAFKTYTVWRFYADPPYWEETVATWSGKYGKDKVIPWWTNRTRQMAYAVRSFRNAMIDGSLSHDGHEGLRRHVANAHRHSTEIKDEKGETLFVIRKERKDSPFKIDSAMAAILSWEARGHAIALGIGATPKKRRAALVWTPNGWMPTDSPTEGHDARPTA